MLTESVVRTNRCNLSASVYSNSNSGSIGHLRIGKRKKLNPDFIEANGKKICVEIMGNYWHSPLLNKKLREDALLSYRKKHYTRYHWKSVFIWGIDLLREDAEDFVLSELRKL